MGVCGGVKMVFGRMVFVCLMGKWFVKKMFAWVFGEVKFLFVYGWMSVSMCL